VEVAASYLTIFSASTCSRDSRQSEDEADADVPPNVVDAEGVPLKTHWTAIKQRV
jgi:hypothetical protein